MSEICDLFPSVFPEIHITNIMILVCLFDLISYIWIGIEDILIESTEFYTLVAKVYEIGTYTSLTLYT